MAYIKEQESYFRTVHGRGGFKVFLYRLFFGVCTPFRFVLEVFIRRQMGERYFSGLLSIFWTIVFIGSYVATFSNQAKAVIPEPYLNNLSSIGIFSVLFFGFSMWRWTESYHKPTTVSFDKYSKSSGYSTLIFKMLGEKNVSSRVIEIWLEPLLFFFIGVVLFLITDTRILGLFLVFCSIMYSFSYRGAYGISRNYILDIIDEKISTSQLGEYMKKGLLNKNVRGFQSRTPVSEKESERKLLSKLILQSDPTGELTSIAE